VPRHPKISAASFPSPTQQSSRKRKPLPQRAQRITEEFLAFSGVPCPVGTAANSPAFQRRVSSARRTPRPRGTPAPVHRLSMCIHRIPDASTFLANKWQPSLRDGSRPLPPPALKRRAISSRSSGAGFLVPTFRRQYPKLFFPSRIPTFHLACNPTFAAETQSAEKQEIETSVTLSALCGKGFCLQLLGDLGDLGGKRFFHREQESNSNLR
jgi:hypothetical protein